MPLTRLHALCLELLTSGDTPALLNELVRTALEITGAVTFNEDFYALAHASHFIQPGAYRIDSTDFGFGGIENVAVLNPDGSIVVLAINTAYAPLTFQVRAHGATFEYTLDTESVATFMWAP